GRAPVRPRGNLGEMSTFGFRPLGSIHLERLAGWQHYQGPAAEVGDARHERALSRRRSATPSARTHEAGDRPSFVLCWFAPRRRARHGTLLLISTMDPRVCLRVVTTWSTQPRLYP